MINKLITEDDLYGAVDAAFAEGWSRVKLYFLIGLPTETDEDTLGIAELARNCVALGRRHGGRHVGDGERRRVRAQAAHPVPVVRAGHRCRAAAQGRPAARRPRAGRATSTSSGTTRRRPSAEGILSRGDRRIGRVIERVWRAGGTFQEWGEHFDLRRWTDALEAEGLSLDWYVHRHRDRSRGAAVGAPDGRAARGLPLGRLAGRRSPASRRWTRLPVDAVLRLRGVHRVRHRARRGVDRRAGRWQPGHRPGPGPWRRAVPRRCCWSAGREAAPALRQARQGALHQPPRHGADLGAGDAAGRRARSRRAPGSRRGPGSASASPCRRAPSRSPSTSTPRCVDGALTPRTTSTSCRRGSTRCCRSGSRCSRRPSWSPAPGRCRRSSRR